MRILKPVGEELELEGRVYHLLFNLNVIDEIQEQYDMPIVDILNSIFDKEDKKKQKESYNTLAYMITVLLNEDIRIHNKKNEKDQWPEVTIEYIREEVLTNSTSGQLSLLILKAFNGTLPKSEDEGPNQESVQTKK